MTMLQNLSLFFVTISLMQLQKDWQKELIAKKKKQKRKTITFNKTSNMKTLKDRILLHQEPFIRGLCQQELPPEK